jgi:pSer/pThr/pTyr-binding forkhead associated (FHA) protein
MRLATLRILEGPEAFAGGRPAGRTVPMLRQELRIGRNPDWVDLQLYGMTDRCAVSRLHCTITYLPGMRTFFVRDEGSTSGTVIVEGGRGKRETERPVKAHQAVELRNGDRLRLGVQGSAGALIEFITTISPVQARAQRMLLEADDVNNTEPSARRVSGFLPMFRRPHNLDLLISPSGDEGDVEPTDEARQYDIFISYSRQDGDMMRRLTRDLRARGLVVWTDETLMPGEESWKRAIEDAIEASRCVVVLLSPSAKQSEWVERELDYASAQRRPIFPVLVKGNEQDAIPFSLIRSQRADMRRDYDAGFRTLLDALNTHLRA